MFSGLLYPVGVACQTQQDAVSNSSMFFIYSSHEYYDGHFPPLHVPPLYGNM